MKQFSIDFQMNSDAFTDYPADEVRRILDKIARNIEDNFPQADEEFSEVIKDINGNTVGTLYVSY